MNLHRSLPTLLAAAATWASSSAQELPPFLGTDEDPPPTSLFADEPSPAVQTALQRCGEIIDSHLHESLAFPTTASLLAEMDGAAVVRGVLMAVYGARASPFSDDPNTSVQKFAEESGGRIYGLVSLNVTGSNWAEVRDEELTRLATFLEMEAVVGAKVAPPHSCLALTSPTMRDIVAAVAHSSRRLLYIHVGTTPFCTPFGLMTQGMIGCCDEEYVDPGLLEGLIAEYANVTFVLLHAGHDFLEEDSEHYYDNEMVDRAIEVAQNHTNVFLEISAFLKRPRANETMSKIANGNLTDRVIYGSDVNHFPGEMLPYLELAVPAMVEAGFTEEEMCMTLRGNAIDVFGLPEDPPGGSDRNATETPVVGRPTMTPTSPPAGEDDSGGEGDSTSGGSSFVLKGWRMIVVGGMGVFLSLL